MQVQTRMRCATAVAILFWALCLAGTGKFVAVVASGPPHAILAVSLIAMTALFGVWRVSSGPVVVSVGTLVSYLTIALLGPWPAVGVKVLGFAISTVFYPNRREWPRYLTVNIAILGTTTLIAGWVYLATGGVVAPASFAPRLALPFLAMAVTYTAVNVVLLAGLRWARTGSPVPRTATDLLARFWVNESIFALVGVLGLAVYGELGEWGLVAIFILLLVVRFIFQLYADAHRFRSDMADVLAQTLTFKDQTTGEHSQRVAAIAVRMGRLMGMADRQLERLRDAALLHDIGKLAIPDAVLVKPGPLEPAERERMDRHVNAGGELLEHSPYLRELATPILAHHIDWATDGAPVRLPLEARIISVADAFDAMTNDRPYRNALPLDEAVRRLRAGAGTQFDPAVVDVLLRTLAADAALGLGPGIAPPPPEPPAPPSGPRDGSRGKKPAPRAAGR